MRSQKMKEVFAFWAVDKFLSISDLDLWLPDHISDAKPLFYSRHYDQPLCNLEAMLYLKSLMHVNNLKIWKKKYKKYLVLWADNSYNKHHGNKSS